nr:cation:proton antiporter [Motilibacter deserti]
MAAALPRVLERRPFSLPLAFLAAGVGIGLLPVGLPELDPVEHGAFVEHAAEVVVIVALMGAGLALDRPFGWRRWSTTWRLLFVAMPVTIALVAWLGSAVAGLPLAAALLLGGVLSPTDPVLAGDVQVGEPSDAEESEDEVRFALTSEAGLNDGLAFPFVMLATAVAAHGGTLGAWLGGWALDDLVLKTVLGVVGGLAVGRLLGRAFFRARRDTLRLSEHADGFVALAVTFLAYGVTEILHGYGFVAVFVAACSIRAAERSHGYHGVLHGFVEQVERLLTAWLLLLLGVAFADGLLEPLTWQLALVGVLLVLVVRPVVGVLSLLGTPAGRRERIVAGAFGVRGIGSLYYLAYALEAEEFPAAELWAAVGFTVAFSVVVHGLTATPVVSHLDELRLHRARRWTRGRPTDEQVAREHV